MDYLVTTRKSRIPSDRQIAMVDGTVPGWESKPGDLHFDHHAPGGGMVQIDEISWTVAQELNGDLEYPLFVTTQVDADACVAAAWMQIGDRCGSEIIRKLRAIALDCDYLGIPPSEWEGYGDLAEFAVKAVAALKESGNDVIADLCLPIDRKSWTEDQQVAYASECFKRGAEWLINAASGKRPWPGESGEADTYFDRMDRQEAAIRELGCVRLIDGSIYFDQRSIAGYIDPRIPQKIGVDMAEAKGIELTGLTLSHRAGTVNLGSEENKILIPASQYTIGTIAWIPGIDLAKSGVFAALVEADKDRRAAIGQPPSATSWGGRAAVGGSGWRDCSLLNPEEVFEIAINLTQA